jgi:hypothetical protein
MKKLQYGALTILGLGFLLASCGDGNPPFDRSGPWGDPTDPTDDDDDDDSGEDGDDRHPLADCVVTHTLAFTEEAWGGYWVRTKFHDGEGRPIRLEFDQDDDGLDSSQSYTYGADSLLSGVSIDNDGDGAEDESWSYIYDVDGKLLRSELRRGSELETIKLRAYDELDRLAYEEDDTDADGTIDLLVTWIYSGDSPMPETMEEDRDADGELDTRTTYIWDESDFLVRQEWDNEANGSVDSAWDYSYNKTGRLARIAADWDGDGTPEEITLTEYDDHGQLSWRSEDTNADGTPDELMRWANTYDEALRLIRIDHDAEDDGSWDAWDTWDYACPEGG